MAERETFEALRQRLRDRFDQLSPHLQRIARAALDRPNEFALKTVSVIATELGIQPSTLIRFAKQFEYDGFSDMQRVFRNRLIEGAAKVREQVYVNRSSARHQADLKETLDGCIDALVASLENLRTSVTGAELTQASDMLRNAGHIYIAGLRRSRPIATYLAYGLSRSERQCSLLDFGGGMAVHQAAAMRPNDVLVAIAFAPYTQAVIEVVADSHLSGRQILAITDGPDSPLAKHSTVAIFVDDAVDSPFRPISGAIALVQCLVTSMGER